MARQKDMFAAKSLDFDRAMEQQLKNNYGIKKEARFCDKAFSLEIAATQDKGPARI
jgi:hypothetical protein